MNLLTVSRIIFILSSLGILFIIARKVPRLSRLPKPSSGKKFSLKHVFDSLKGVIITIVSSDFFQNIIIAGLEKSLRKFKIVALKIDNRVDKFLRRLKKSS